MKEKEMMTTMSGKKDEQRMTSLDIAAVTGKQHKDVLKAIRNMESAWEKECGRKFALTSEKLSMPQSGFAQDRSFHYYALDGEKKERKYLVWTPIGMEFIRTIV